MVKANAHATVPIEIKSFAELCVKVKVGLTCACIYMDDYMQCATVPVRNKHYSIAYFDHITAFEALQCRTSAKVGLSTNKLIVANVHVL